MRDSNRQNKNGHVVANRFPNHDEDAADDDDDDDNDKVWYSSWQQRQQYAVAVTSTAIYAD
ncbi:hypothetical protein V1478_015968 [Vespula squamosa]|uniref:Uncharacterized protein n=1 Tax=Vespula squamosa TaxID=30214 RepID=A0ABD2A2C7_VESSQ